MPRQKNLSRIALATLALPLACLPMQALAAGSADGDARSSVLSRLPDTTVERLQELVTPRPDSALRESLRRKLDELREDAASDDAADAQPATQARSAGAAPARTATKEQREHAAVRRVPGHRAEMQQYRDAQLKELESLAGEVGRLGGAEKARVVRQLAEQVRARFDRLDAALKRVEGAREAGERGRARVALAGLLDGLREPAPQIASGPIPMRTRNSHRPRQPDALRPSRVLPQYMVQILKDRGLVPDGRGGVVAQAAKPAAARGDAVVPDADPYAAQGWGYVKASMTQPAVAPDAAADCGSNADDLKDDGAEVRLTPEIKALAQSLQYSPVRIMRWMLKEVEFEPYWGSMKGSVGVLQTRRGNATDQSALLVALLRASNVPARFVMGTVNVVDPQPTDNANGRAQRWLGTKSYSASMAYLNGGNVGTIASVLTAGGPTQGLTVNHVWVQACVPFASYRGNASGAGGYRWLPLDPSIKDHDYQAGMAVNLTLDNSGFFLPYLSQRTNKLPAEYLGDKVEAAARTARSDASRLDVPYEGRLRGLKVDVLSTSTPAAVQNFVNWPGLSSPETAAIPDGHRNKFVITVQNAGGATLATTTLSFPQNVASRVTLSYQPDAASQALWNSWGGALAALPAGTVNVYPQIKVDGTVVATGSSTLPLNAAHKLIMKIRQGEATAGGCMADSGNRGDPKDPDANCMSKTVYTTLQAGSYYALGVNAHQTSNASLNAIASALTAGVNGNPAAPTPANGAAYENTVGQLLHLVLHSYMDSYVSADKEIAGLLGYRNVDGNDLGITGSELKTEYVFDLPLTVKPAGVFVDFKGAILNFVKLDSTVPTKGNAGEAADAFWARRTALLIAESNVPSKLAAYSASAWEHRVWQEALRMDAVSTVRGLQYAAETGNSLVTFTSANIGQYASLMQMSGPTSMAGYQTQITTTVNAGFTVTVPRAQIAYADPVEPAKAWRGAVYMAENTTTGSYGAVIDGKLSGGFPLVNRTPISSVFYRPPLAPSFQSVINSGLGLLTTLTPGTQGNNTFATYVGDPVNMLTGNFVHQETDFTIKGRGGLNIVLTRWYNSGEPKDGPLGFGWTHSFNHQLKLYGVENGAAKVSWINGSGGENYFTTASHTNGDVARGAIFANPAGIESQFSRISGGANDGKFQIREQDGTVYLFASATGPNTAPSPTSPVTANLLSITDRNGNALTLSYANGKLSAVVDGIGRAVLTFTWTGNRLTQVADHSGRKVVYAYTDGNGNLNRVTDPLSQQKNYTYYTSVDGAKLDHHLKRYALPRGNGMEFSYYSGGQVFKHTAFDTKGELLPNATTTFHYNLFNRESWSVNERGFEHRTTFDNYGNALRIVQEDGAAYAYSYDTANPYNRLTETDPIGRVTSYTYTTGSQKNLLETTTLPSGATVEYRDYNAFGQPQRTKDARGNWTWRQYDAKGNTTEAIQVKAGTTPVAGTRPAAASIVSWLKTSYDGYGNAVTITRVKDFAAGTGPSLTQNWDTNKLNLLSLTRAGNRDGTTVSESTPTFTYDTLGRQKTGVDARWYATSFSYDALDRVVSATDSLGKTRNFKFDANGNAVESEVTDGGKRIDATVSSYDARDRQSDVLDYAGNRVFFSHDGSGNITSQTSADNFTVSFDYDEGNRPVATYDAEGNRAYTQLDALGRTTRSVDPNGNAVSYDYWGKSGNSFQYDGRLKRVTQPAIPGQAAGRATEYEYDAGGNVVRTRSIAGDGTSTRLSHAFYDELGRAVRQVGFPDDAGNRLQVCSRFDTLSNLTELWAGPTTDVTSTVCNFSDASLKKQAKNTWDDFGGQLSREDQLGRSWLYAYDIHGNLRTSRNPEQVKAGSQTTYEYDSRLNGLLKTRFVTGAGSAGQRVTYIRNGLGQVIRAETRDGGGTLLVTYDYVYDAAHRLVRVEDSRGRKALSYKWTPGSRLSKITLGEGDTVTHSWDVKYDAVGRLAALVAPNGQTVSYALDPAGRIVERSFGNGLTSQYAWLPDGSLQNVVHLTQAANDGTWVGNSATTQLARSAYTYDKWGNRQTATDTLGGVAYPQTFGYDALDRLKTVSDGVAANLQTYGFDIFGNRTSKVVGNPATESLAYAVDAAHQLSEVRRTVAANTATSDFLRYDDNGNLKRHCAAGGSGGTVSGTATDCAAAGTGASVASYSWNGADQLVGFSRTGLPLSETYSYDDSGRRIRKISGTAATHYLYDGEDILGEWNGTTLAGSPAAVYVHGAGTDDPLLRLGGNTGSPDADAAAYAPDGLGSVVAMLGLGTGKGANQTPLAANTLATTGDFNAATYPPAHLKDGVTIPSNNTGWVGAVANGAAVTLTLGSTQTVERVEIMAVSTYLPSSYVVEVKNLDSTWRQVASGTAADFTNYEGASRRAVKSFAASPTRGVRVRFTGAAQGVVWLTEWQVWNTTATVATQRFDAWGQRIAFDGAIPTYGYTGREADATGLAYYRARYYNPALGRFISRDPLGQAGGIGVYSYADGNPINLSDPDGLLARQVGNRMTNYAGQGLEFVGGVLRSAGNSAINALATSHFSSMGYSQADASKLGQFNVIPQMFPGSGAEQRGAQAYGLASQAVNVGLGVRDTVDSLSDLELSAAYKSGTSTFQMGATLVGMISIARSGPVGVDPGHHNANVTVRDANGNLVSHSRLVSGNMTPAEAALGFPQNTLASHTEARAVQGANLQAGQSMTITGQLPPCPSCKGKMNTASQETGASITYQWRENGKTNKWVARGKK